MEELLPVFVEIGLSEQKAKETIKNERVSKNLQEIIVEVGILQKSAKFREV